MASSLRLLRDNALALVLLGGAIRLVAAAEPIAADTLSAVDIDTLNRNSPFQPVFFAYDQDTIDAAGRYREAVDAFQKVIANYPQSDTVAVAYYKMGLAYTELKQLDLARKAFEAVIEKYPTAYEAILAKQRLEFLKGK